MNELDRLIRRAGGVMVSNGRHRAYLLDGERFTRHQGRHMGRRETIAVKSKLRQIQKRRAAR